MATTAHSKFKQPYKEPVFLFTSGSLRFAAWAGWHSAFGDAEKSEQWAHQARIEWMKEVAAGRRHPFLGGYNNAIHQHIPSERFKVLLDIFLKAIKAELKKNKKKKESNF